MRQDQFKPKTSARTEQSEETPHKPAWTRGCVGAPRGVPGGPGRRVRVRLSLGRSRRPFENVSCASLHFLLSFSRLLGSSSTLYPGLALSALCVCPRDHQGHYRCGGRVGTGTLFSFYDIFIDFPVRGTLAHVSTGLPSPQINHALQPPQFTSPVLMWFEKVPLPVENADSLF